jgi:hypothetical protein
MHACTCFAERIESTHTQKHTHTHTHTHARARRTVKTHLLLDTGPGKEAAQSASGAQDGAEPATADARRSLAETRDAMPGFAPLSHAPLPSPLMRSVMPAGSLASATQGVPISVGTQMLSSQQPYGMVYQHYPGQPPTLAPMGAPPGMFFHPSFSPTGLPPGYSLPPHMAGALSAGNMAVVSQALSPSFPMPYGLPGLHGMHGQMLFQGPAGPAMMFHQPPQQPQAPPPAALALADPGEPSEGEC